MAKWREANDMKLTKAQSSALRDRNMAVQAMDKSVTKNKTPKTGKPTDKREH